MFRTLGIISSETLKLKEIIYNEARFAERILQAGKMLEEGNKEALHELAKLYADVLAYETVAIFYLIKDEAEMILSSVTEQERKEVQEVAKQIYKYTGTNIFRLIPVLYELIILIAEKIREMMSNDYTYR